MTYADFETWGLPVTFVAAIAICVTMNQTPISPANALEGARELRAPADVTMTITAKRLPAECKGAAAAANAATCAAYFDEAPTIAVRGAGN